MRSEVTQFNQDPSSGGQLTRHLESMVPHSPEQSLIAFPLRCLLRTPNNEVLLLIFLETLTLYHAISVSAISQPSMRHKQAS